MAVGALAGLAVALAAHLIHIHATGNMHAVVPGVLYRSGQVDAEELARWQREHGIRSVLNLRGERPDKAWYREEAAAAEELGLVLANFRMGASREIGPERAAELLALMRDLPKPLLVHCRQGSDRTGLAAAMFVAAVEGDEAGAEGQLSIAYGHVAVPFLSQGYAMTASWEKVRDTLVLAEAR
jgi:protein tyrosine/serine phosphatase